MADTTATDAIDTTGGFVAFDLGDFECPRCGMRVAEEYYGPCTACRGELSDKYRGEARDVEAAAYEPKMNVTPNAVATKD